MTAEVPKMLLEVAGRPFAEWQLSWLASQGIERVVLSIGHLGGALREYVGDGSPWGLEVVVVDEGEDLKGTGGAVRRAVDAGVMEDWFAVLYGDAYLSLNLEEVARVFAGVGEPALMTVYRNANRFEQSNVVYAGGRVLRYEKGATGTPGMEWIDYGLSVLRRDLVEARIRAGVSDLAAFFTALSAEGLLAGYEAGERPYEIGSPEGLAELEVLLGRPARASPEQ